MTHPLIVIRHGETDWNRQARLQGQRDIPLNDLGRQQARRNGRAIIPLLNGQQWDWVSSPLGRARETLEIVMLEAGIAKKQYRTDERLRELSFGAFEGYTMAEVAEFDNDAAAARELDKWGYVPPGGESYQMLSERVAEWLASISGPTVVGGHGGIVRVLLHNVADLPATDVPMIPIPQDRLALFTDGKVEYM